MKETEYWVWFLVAAVVILLCGGLHMTVMHVPSLGIFNPAGGAVTDWTNVAFRSKHPFVVATYVLLLAAALYHGLYGLRTIVLELGPNKTFQGAFTAILWIAGIALFGYGAYAAVAAKYIGTAL